MTKFLHHYIQVELNPWIIYLIIPVCKDLALVSDTFTSENFY